MKRSAATVTDDEVGEKVLRREIDSENMRER